MNFDKNGKLPFTDESMLCKLNGLQINFLTAVRTLA